MFHDTHKVLIMSYLTLILACSNALAQVQKSHFDAENGFKSAQTNLTEIFLQLAGSLEHHGSPEPYLRHMKAEHRRIEAAYDAKYGKKLVSYCPAYMTDEYISGLIANWDKLAPKLGLEELARKSGRRMRFAIDGDEGKGTVAVLIFNSHQNLVYDEMVASGARTVGFDQLRAEFVRLGEEGEIPFLVELESDLTDAEKASYRALLEKPRFAKADFAAIEKFYDGPYDKLSEYGKSQMSARTFAGTKGVDVPPSEAKKYVAEFCGGFEDLFKDLDSQLSPELAAKIKNSITGTQLDVGRMAHSKFQLGIVEWSISKK